MLLYILFFLACVIIAVGFLFLYRSLSDIGKIVYSAFLPKGSRTPKPKVKPLPERNLATTVNDTPTPWGWSERKATVKPARPVMTATPAKTPWGWPGNHHAMREHGGINGAHNGSPEHRDHATKPGSIVSPDVGWPYREEKFEFGGKNYKVVRKTTPKPTDLSKTSKPWGW